MSLLLVTVRASPIFGFNGTAGDDEGVMPITYTGIARVYGLKNVQGMFATRILHFSYAD